MVTMIKINAMAGAVMGHRDQILPGKQVLSTKSQGASRRRLKPMLQCIGGLVAPVSPMGLGVEGGGEFLDDLSIVQCSR